MTNDVKIRPIDLVQMHDAHVRRGFDFDHGLILDSHALQAHEHCGQLLIRVQSMTEALNDMLEVNTIRAMDPQLRVATEEQRKLLIEAPRTAARLTILNGDPE